MGKHTHQQQSTQTGVDTLTKSTFVARLVANILTNIVTYIVVDMSPNVARDVYTVFSTCRVTSLVRCGRTLKIPKSPKSQE